MSKNNQHNIDGSSIFFLLIFFLNIIYKKIDK